MEKCGIFNTGEEVFININGEYVLGRYLGLEEVEDGSEFYLAEIYELADGRLWDIRVDY